MINFDDKSPIYRQIIRDIKYKIISGEWQAGEKILSIRKMASLYEVNPNTVQKAFQELEDEELVYSERTAGRFVTKNKLLIESYRYKEAKAITKIFLKEMEELGYSRQEIIEFLPDTLIETDSEE